MKNTMEETEQALSHIIVNSKGVDAMDDKVRKLEDLATTFCNMNAELSQLKRASTSGKGSSKGSAASGSAKP